MGRIRCVPELGVFTGGALSANRFEINGREDGVLGLGTTGSFFLEQRYRGLAAARALKDVDVQVRHGRSPVVATSISLAGNLYFPMQNELKMRFRISSAVVAPVISSSGRSAL